MRISLASAKAKATLRWYLLMILFGGIAGAGYGAFISGLKGFVTLPNKEREEPAAAIFSGGSDRCPPRVHGRRTEGAVRSRAFSYHLRS